MTSPRSGRQEPTTSFVLPYRQTDGETAIELYELTGRTALPWQKNLIYDILGRHEDGLWTHLQFGYEVPRQNGKGEIVEDSSDGFWRNFNAWESADLYQPHFIRVFGWQKLFGVPDLGPVTDAGIIEYEKMK